MNKTKKISDTLAQELTWYAEANSDITQIKDPNLLRNFKELQQRNEFIIFSFLWKLFPDDILKKEMTIRGSNGTYTELSNFTKDKDIAVGFKSYATSSLVIGAEISVKSEDKWNDVFNVQTRPLDNNVPMLRYVKYPSINATMPIMDCYAEFLIPYNEGYLFFSNANELNTFTTTYIENKGLEPKLLEVKFYIKENNIEKQNVDLADMTVGDLFNLIVSKNYEVLYDKVNNRGLK